MEESPEKQHVISCLMLTPCATCGRDPCWLFISRTEPWQELRAQMKPRQTSSSSFRNRSQA